MTDKNNTSQEFGLSNLIDNSAGLKEQTINLSDDLVLTTTRGSTARKRKIRYIGFVQAGPDEYLLHIRRGKVRSSSGQGGRCLKLYGDTVVIIPTTIKQLLFEAGSLTKDNVQVRIRGFASYYIEDPEKIYKRVNFEDALEGDKNLGVIIGQPCRAQTKQLVTNLTYESCMRKRKEEIADALKREFELTSQLSELGVKVREMDVFDVRVDKELYQALQEPKRQEEIQKGELARLEKDRAVRLRKILADMEVSEQEHQLNIKNAEQEETFRREKAENELKQLTDRLQLDRTAEEAAEELARYKESEAIKRKTMTAEADVLHGLERLKLDERRFSQEMEHRRESQELDKGLSEITLERMYIEKVLPDATKLLCEAIREADITIFGGGGKLNVPVDGLVAQLASMAKARLKVSQEASE